jgi:hypothetical protein
MSYKTITQIVQEEAVRGVSASIPATPSPTFNKDDVQARFVCDDAKERKAIAEVYYKGVLVGWVEVTHSMEATFKLKS